jgi:hypothetical protein
MMFWLGHMSIKTTEINSHLTDKHIQAVVSRFPRPNLGKILDTPVVLPGRSMAQKPRHFQGSYFSS